MGITTIIGNIITDTGATLGSANGVATLDSSGKIPASQLPNSVMEFKGMWDASSNTPTLANGTGNAGDVYEVSAAGSVNFGAGAISFAVGDYVVYDGSEWQFSSGQKGTVTSIIAGTGLSGGTISTSGTIAFDTTWGDARYQLAGSYVPTTRTLTINGTTYDLSANRTWTVSGGLSTDIDSEQTVGGRIYYFNNGAGRMNADARWNESGFDADLGCLHIWAWTAGGSPYGRAGIALYNDGSYQYLTTKSGTAGLFINNTQIVTNGGTWAINISGSSANTSSISYAVGGAYTWTGTQYFQSNLGGYSGSLSGPALQAWASGGNSAFMSFHRSAAYAVNFGLDADNVLRIGGWSASANRWELDMSGNNTVAGSFRAPIFYDSNNTDYYTDPNSISSMYGIAIRGDAASTAIQNQIFFWGASASTTSAIGFKYNGGYFSNPTGAGDGYNTYFTMDTDGRGWVFRRGAGGGDFGAAYTSGWILNNGTWQANGQMRSPQFSLLNGFTISQEGANYAQFNSWVFLPGAHGFYAGLNNAHFYPNDGTYGSWKVIGSRNGWQGIEFASGSAGAVTLMVAGDSNTSGFHNNSYGWQLRWANGTLYCYKSGYGGGTAAVVVDDSNSPWAYNMNQYVRTSDSPTFNGVYSNNWFRANGDSGFYTQDYGGHLRRTIAASHGTWEAFGYNKGGYVGMCLNDSGGYLHNLMYSSTGKGGIYSENGAGGWNFYYNRDYNSLSLMTSGNGGTADIIYWTHILFSYGSYNSFSGPVYGSYFGPSDIRYKKNIRSTPYGLDEILQLNTIMYEYDFEENKAYDTHIGFSAQEVLTIMPELVIEDRSSGNNGSANRLAMNTNGLQGVIVNAIQEQNRSVEELKYEIEELKYEIAQLKSQLN